MIETLVILLALSAGLLVTWLRLPALVGYLAAGFVIPLLAQRWPEFGQLNLQPLADAGVTLLLFSIGLKLDLRSLLRIEIWGTTVLQVSACVVLFCLPLVLLKGMGWQLLQPLEFSHLALLAFALSFSSTVFAVQILEQRGEMASLHGRIAVGILVMQDIIAVAYLATATGTSPGWYAPIILLLIPLRTTFNRLLQRSGHGELLILCGFALAFGGYALFTAVGLKGDLGALFMGALLAGMGKSAELAKALFQFKNVLLVGFFLTVGQFGLPSAAGWVLVALFAALVLVKPVIYLSLLLLLRQRSRTAWYTALTLTTHSEFGLIVMALAVASGDLGGEWMVIVAVAMSLSFVAGSLLEAVAAPWYRRYGHRLRQWQRPEADLPLRVNIGSNATLILGMGRVGSGAYDYLVQTEGGNIVGVEENENKQKLHLAAGRKVIEGDASDREFWMRLPLGQVDRVIMSLSNHAETLDVAKLLLEHGFTGVLAAAAHYPDEEKELEQLGVITFNLYAEAGAGFAEHIRRQSFPGSA